MTPSFDPRPALADFLHPTVCPAHAGQIEPAACLRLPDAVEAYVSQLASAGLAVVPVPAVKLLARLFADATDADEAATGCEQVPASGSEARALAMTWLVSRLADGGERREGPFTRAWGEILLGDLNLSHGADVVSARLEGEHAWLAELGSLFEQNASDWLT